MKNFFYILFFCCSISFGQSFSLGENYLDQGEYEKAKSIFKSLYEKQPRSQKYLLAYTKALTELEQLDEAEEVLLNYLKSTNRYPNIDVELGQIYQRQDKNDLAEKRYQIAIESISENPNFAYSVGQAFQEYNLLDEAAMVYEKANELQPRINYKIQLARIYGEQGNLEKMFQNYIYLILESPNYFNVVSRNFNEYITEDPQSEANIVFKRLLLKELQKKPNVLYNQLLSWLFVQEGDFNKAFAQEKAIYKRSENPKFDRIIELAQVAGDNTLNVAVSEPILNYVIDEAQNQRIQLRAIQELMEQKVAFANANRYEAIKTDFENFLTTYERKPNTAALQLLQARFLAFQLQEKEEAKQSINQLLSQSINTFTQATTKILLADIFVLEEQFNQALIYYSQVEKLVKNTDMAQEAKFKVAKTSYYKGDFDWAVTQLDVLKKATSQFIANDAMSLARHIKDNSYQDSIQTALQKVAKADLLEFQEQNEMALTILDEVLTDFNGEPIEDEALFRKAKIHEKLNNFEAAADAYQQIIEFYPLDVLADDALFAIAKLYQNQLNEPDKAKKYYEKIIFDHPDSIYFVDAQKAFRKLRGDAIN
ncbi:tetratricopeptide repeat protein [Psychroflexus planctonicus]|uniref:Tetratricopeptide repeat-containing protein n=1 Tax=Psychroflexus planctonicus TaxID=1526575 RepID=A0ABQ1SHK2_9FLAO|nr:tetratricopeptide repeat protein [Psychroflexus planctonicus]GGE39989.1 hypothetical protein GCM10010832_20200 [Psychroflexus planctonicus]